MKTFQWSERILAWMVARLSEELKLPSENIDTRKPLLEYGLDSVVAFTLTGDLAEWLGRDLPATLFWDFPTIEALALHLADNIEDAAVAEYEFSKSGKKRN